MTHVEASLPRPSRAATYRLLFERNPQRGRDVPVTP
jgi:hypothetical protein